MAELAISCITVDRAKYTGGIQRNVVAYPQNPDAALTSLGVSPASLAGMLQVQFVGENRADLHHAPDLRVSVQKLREAFRWLSGISWPFMEATKTHALWESDLLDKSLEDLLRTYVASAASPESGVPAEIIQGATQIPPERAGALAAGPSNCTDTSDENGVGLGGDNELDGEVGNNCVGVLDGGVDDISPVQIWDQGHAKI